MYNKNTTGVYLPFRYFS